MQYKSIYTHEKKDRGREKKTYFGYAMVIKSMATTKTSQKRHIPRFLFGNCMHTCDTDGNCRQAFT